MGAISFLIAGVIALLPVILAVAGSTVANNISPLNERQLWVVGIIFGALAILFIALSLIQARRGSSQPRPRRIRKTEEVVDAGFREEPPTPQTTAPIAKPPNPISSLALKYHCLDKCRSPFSFIAGHWSGGDEAVQAVRLGADHGLFCVGCCCSLMLLMFGVGAGNIGWMLVLGSVMALEKNMPWGRRLSKPLGVTLIVCGAIVTLGYGSLPG